MRNSPSSRRATSRVPPISKVTCRSPWVMAAGSSLSAQIFSTSFRAAPGTTKDSPSGTSPASFPRRRARR